MQVSRKPSLKRAACSAMLQNEKQPYPVAPLAQNGPPPPFVAQQPMMQPGMAIVKNAKGLPVDGKGERDWSEGLCSRCCGGTWWLSFCCPCIQYGKNASRLAHLREQGRVHPEGGDSCGSDSIIFCAVFVASEFVRPSILTFAPTATSLPVAAAFST